ncbi:EI24 domain-containing protein [Thermodesulfobacteriota bacterium]
MSFLQGIRYNFRGLRFGLKSGKLLLLGLSHFVIVILITLISAGLILAYHQQILDLLWAKPASAWIVWLWHLLSWLLSIFLVGIAAILSFLLSQILFCVLIMDQMSRITERMVTGSVEEPKDVPLWRLFLYLLKQEIPRAILPIFLTLLVMIMSWFIALGPVFVVIGSALAAIFLAWDNTDLLPARRLLPFKQRFQSLLKTILFHLGFGLLFLIPFLNLFFLSFAPVGATLYHLEKQKS